MKAKPIALCDAAEPHPNRPWKERRKRPLLGGTAVLPLFGRDAFADHALLARLGLEFAFERRWRVDHDGLLSVVVGPASGRRAKHETPPEGCAGWGPFPHRARLLRDSAKQIRQVVPEAQNGAGGMLTLVKALRAVYSQSLARAHNEFYSPSSAPAARAPRRDCRQSCCRIRDRGRRPLAPEVGDRRRLARTLTLRRLRRVVTSLRSSPGGSPPHAVLA